MRFYGASGVGKNKPSQYHSKPRLPGYDYTGAFKKAVELTAQATITTLGFLKDRAQEMRAARAQHMKSQIPRSVHTTPQGHETQRIVRPIVFKLPNLPIGSVISESFGFLFSWTPFVIALLLTGVVIRQVTNDFDVFINPIPPQAIKEIEKPKARDGRTPTTPPIIYEQGIEPFTNHDDRVPISELSNQYNLSDPMLVNKVTGIGAIYTSQGRCTASLIGRNDFIVTAAHCLSGSATSSIRFYSMACEEFYYAAAKFVKTEHPKKNTDLDYAFVKLKVPACDKAKPFQALTLTDEAAERLKTNNHPLLSLSVFPFTDTRRHKEFEDAWKQALFRYGKLTTFGVFGRFAKGRSNVAEHNDSLAYYVEQVDPFNGASGGPLLISLDGGKTYQIIGTLFGHEVLSRIAIYPRVKGKFAKNLEHFFAIWDRDIGS